MATVADYYTTDFSLPVWLGMEWRIIHDRVEHNIKVSIFTDFSSNAKYIAVYFGRYIRKGQILIDILLQYESFLDTVSNIVLGRTARVGTQMRVNPLGDNSIDLFYRMPADKKEIEHKQLVFTGRIYLYVENRLDQEVIAELDRIALDKGLSVICRDSTYAENKDQYEIPKAFISHDSRDKDAIARRIASTLTSMLCPVWFDEYSLSVGESLREGIENGLRKCNKCILVVTPNFLSKGGWPKREYDIAFTRELVEDKDVILPVWAGVTSDEVYEYSPTLAGRKALYWKPGTEEEVCRKLFSNLIGGI